MVESSTHFADIRLLIHLKNDRSKTYIDYVLLINTDCRFMKNKAQRILIVDDDQDILSNLSDILSDLGYVTDTAPTGEDALDKILSNCSTECVYDLCLLDFKMPGIDGVELYERIQKRNPRLRAIMITAYAGEDGIQRAIAAGAWQVLRKPVDVPALLGAIERAMA